MDVPYLFLHISDIFPKYSLVYFSNFGVKSSFGHEQMTSVGQISHASVPKLSFCGNFIMVLHGVASRSQKALF